MSAAVRFETVGEQGWKRGLGNLTRGELSAWFKSGRWWKHLVVWLLVIDLILLFVMLAPAPPGGAKGPDVVFLYGVFGGLFVSIGVMVVMQWAIVGEKTSGTAAWVLSKPVTRTAFVVSRLLVNALGIVVTAVIVPALLFYVLLGAISSVGWLPPLGFLAGVGILVVHVVFWATLTWMMGTFSSSTAVVIAVPLAIFFGLWFLPPYVPGLVYVSPLTLAIGEEGGGFQALATSLMKGEAPYSWIPLISALGFSTAFVAAGILRFNREEF
jgi:ABC-2 type transport system permease protein